jgi:hypothetical protein
LSNVPSRKRRKKRNSPHHSDRHFQQSSLVVRDFACKNGENEYTPPHLNARPKEEWHMSRFSTLLFTGLFLGQCLHEQALAQTPSEPLVTKVYSVSDLINPCNTISLKVTLPESASGTGQSPELQTSSEACEPPSTEDELIKLVAAVAPASWCEKGGNGRIDFFPLGKALVIGQTQGVQEQITHLLEKLRHYQEAEVTLDLRVFRLSEESLAILHREGASSSTGASVVLLDNAHLHELLQTNPKAEVIHTPRITVLNGQGTKISVVDNGVFVTSLDEKEINGQKTYVPKNEVLEWGANWHIRPTVSADRRFVRLAVDSQAKELVLPVALHPVTTTISPVFEGGAIGKPIQFTQFIQQPKFNASRSSQTVVLHDGSSALIDGWIHRDVVNAQPRTVLTDLPVVGACFLCPQPKPEHVMLLVTAHVVGDDQAISEPTAAASPSIAPCCAQKCDAPCCRAPVSGQQTVTELIAKYERACREHRHAEATTLAVQALALDPTCFAGSITPHK